ncbi:MAG: hypothetical protein JWN48_5676 [Myxococcaceae bacterium]|nr:hypothetical protein [Myxococcaceae bacterium]
MESSKLLRLACACLAGSGCAPDWSVPTVADAAADSTSPSSPDASGDAGRPHVGTGRQGDGTLAGSPDASQLAPRDAGPSAHADASKPAQDAAPTPPGADKTCIPYNSWSLRQVEQQGGKCDASKPEAVVTFDGDLVDFLIGHDDCSLLYDVESDGCSLTYDQTCKRAGTTILERNQGTLRMAAPDRIEGTILVQLVDLNQGPGVVCTSNAEVTLTQL